MNGRNAISGAVVLFVVACSSNVAAQAAGDDCASGACTPGAPLATGHVDPRFEATRVVLERFGPDSPYFGPEGLGDVRADGAGGLLRFRRRLDEAELAELRRAGVEFLSRTGQVVSVGSIYGAFVRWEALDALRKHPLLAYAEMSWHPRLEVPLEVTGPRIRATQNLGLGLPDHDGAGTVIGDLDSGIDVLHPHFFFADGGAFDWIDVDEDGALTPGVDAVDYNEDGEPDGNETLRVLDGAWIDPRGETHNADGVLDGQLDWVYADQNRDEERNVGASAGFTELDPAYGEPLFIIDDADADGVVDPDEKLLLLKSSKVRRFVSTNETWERGTNLIDAAAVDFIDRTFHGTGVASILVGGQPRAHRRVGIAPGAEIVMYSSHMDAPGNGFDDAPQLADLQDAVQSGLDVVVHEWTNPYTAPHDGSGNFEAAMDEARATGVVQVNPLGNMNLSEKHQIVEAVAGSPVELTFVVDDGWRQGNELLPYSAIYGSVFWRGDHLPTLALENPDGTTVTMPRDGTVVEVGEDFLQATHSRTSRGTHHVVVFLWNEDRETSVRKGDWTVHVTDTEVDDRFVGRIADYYSSWGVGVRWARPTFDEGTIVYVAPSTDPSLSNRM